MKNHRQMPKKKILWHMHHNVQSNNWHINDLLPKPHVMRHIIFHYCNTFGVTNSNSFLYRHFRRIQEKPIDMQSCERNAKKLRIQHVTWIQLNKYWNGWKIRAKMRQKEKKNEFLVTKKKSNFMLRMWNLFIGWISSKRQIDINKPKCTYRNLHIYFR